MKGRNPQAIITDIDTGLGEAIRSEFPNTKHVISLYSILPRISSWFCLPLGPRFREFKYEFEALYNLESTEDFEFRWNQMVSHFELNSDKHIALLFSLRACWAFPYTRGCFLAKMVSSSFWKSLDDLAEFSKDIPVYAVFLAGLSSVIGKYFFHLFLFVSLCLV